MSAEPLVSIIIPTFNRAHLIGETLDSVLAQTYLNWECIVVDDGSTDGTEVLLKSYVAKDRRFQYHKRPDTHLPGGNGARNYGFEVSKGEYVNWLDSDDLISENKIKSQVPNLYLDNECSIVTCRWGTFEFKEKIDIKEDEPYYNNYNEALELFNDFSKNGGFFPQHVYLLKRKIISLSGLWDESLVINQDGEFFCRVLLNCEKIIFNKEGSVYYRKQISDNTSLVNNSKKAQKRIDSWNLINEHLYQKYNLRDTIYIQKVKDILYNQIKKDYPQVILINRDFFLKQLKNESSSVIILKRKIKIILNYFKKK
ncbi:glycosyltransferase family 2 protein [Lacinutrix sp. MEBiC02595]